MQVVGGTFWLSNSGSVVKTYSYLVLDQFWCGLSLIYYSLYLFQILQHHSFATNSQLVDVLPKMMCDYYFIDPSFLLSVPHTRPYNGILCSC